MPVLPQTSILFGDLSAVLSTTSAKTYSLPIKISTVNNKVTVVQLELSYDPKILTDVKVNTGTFFANPFIPINQVNEKDGRISYAISINPQDTGRQGNGLLATLTFQTQTSASQSTRIVLLPKSLVVAEGTDRSVLKATTSAQFTVGEAPAQ
ncbi:MAG: cohesin domain-containing protein, partial [bacterium]|nr:cohesin domain-containing protein [bacterium]